MNVDKVLFLDLDHTIIKPKSGGTFPKDINDWEFIKGVVSKITEYLEFGYRVVIVTNQGGIEAGHTTKEEVEQKLDIIISTLERLTKTRKLITAYYSASLDKSSYDRKPNAGMAYKAAVDLQLSNLSKCIMVGDRESDKEFAGNARIGFFIYASDFIKSSPAAISKL